MTPIRKLLVGLDLSEGSRLLLDSLPGLHPWGVEELILTHVVSGSPVPIIHRRDFTDGVSGGLAAAEAWLEPYFRIEMCVVKGRPGRCLAEAAQERGADGIVLGARQRGALSGGPVGDTLGEVARGTRLPILVFPEAALGARRTRPILSPREGRILHPTGLSGADRGAAALVRDLASETSLPVTLLHVVENGRAREDHDHEQELEDLAGELRAAGVPKVEVLLDHGLPWQRILTRAAEEPRTLIVMGTHARGPVPALVLGSQSREIVRRSPLPLLLVPG